MKTAKIKEILNIRDYDGQHGKTYYFQLEMDNGDTGSIGKKSKDALKVGDELTYELEQGERGNKIKPVQPANGFNGGGKPRGASPEELKMKNRSMALAYSKDLVIAMIANGMVTPNLSSSDIAKVVKNVAADFVEWIEA